MNNSVLPIGAVILLKEAKDPLMIIGYLAKGIDGKERDYMGVVYPVGLISIRHVNAFNHVDIDKVIFEGYMENDFFKNFSKKVNIDNKSNTNI